MYMLKVIILAVSVFCYGSRPVLLAVLRVLRFVWVGRRFDTWIHLWTTGEM